MAKVLCVKRWLAITLALSVASCSSPVPRPNESLLRDQLAVLVNRVSNTDQQYWDNSVVDKQIGAALPRGSATSLGWMLEWEPADGALAYAIIPWSMMSITDPQIEPKTIYDGGVSPRSKQARAVEDAVLGSLDSALINIVSVHSIRISGSYAAFSVTPLLPVADDAYGFAHLVSGRWEVIDLGTSDVGCGLVPASVLSDFKVECNS